MSGLNKVILIGNLGRDPEMRFTPEGTPVTDFSLAVSTGKKDDTVWFRVVCWQGLAEKVNEYLVKGRQVYVEGRLHPKTWEGKDGQLRTSLDVMADKVVFLGAKPEAEPIVQALAETGVKAEPIIPAPIEAEAEAELELEPTLIAEGSPFPEDS